MPIFKERKERKKFGLPIILSLPDDGLELPARLNDFSEGGLSFKSNVLFPEDELLMVKIPCPQGVFLHERMDPICFNVIVRWFKEFKDDKDILVKYIHGCRFENDVASIKKDVNDLIKLSEKLGERPLGF